MNYIKKSNLSLFISMDNDYIIEFERKPFILWSTETSFKYLCKFIFKNNLGITLFELITSEHDIFGLIENMYQFVEFGMYDIGFTFNQNNTTLNEFSFGFIRDNNDPNINYFKISEYNPIMETMINRVLIRLDDGYLFDFIYTIYKNFIEDIDECGLSPDFLY